MDWEMAVAFATLFSVAGWFVFKAMAWFRANAERREAARMEEAAKNDEAREKVEVRLGALERGQASIMAELRGVKETLDRFFVTREADRAVLMELKAEMAGFKSSLDNLSRLHREGMEIHKESIAALEARMGALERRFDRLEEKVEGLGAEVSSLRAEFEEFREAVLPRARPAGAAP